MILDKLENSQKYELMIKNLKNGIEFIRNSNDLKTGRYEWEGGFALVQEGETCSIEEGFFETHKNYIDIQYMAEGSELLEWADVKDLEERISYNQEKDAAFFVGKGTVMRISKGMFYIMFPHDAHKACCHSDEKTNFRKIVVKCKI